MEQHRRTGRRLPLRVGAAAAVVAALVVPAYAPSADGGPADVLAVGQSPEGETTTSTSRDDSTTTTDTTAATTTTVRLDTTDTTASTVPDPGPAGGDMDGPAGDGMGHDPDADPSDMFPDDWTPDQVAYAEGLIADTEAALERYANPGILPLLGFTWILDGQQRDGYQHWINLGWFGDGHILDPEFPESLVFRNTEDGPVLEAAMYMLPWGYDLSNIPEDIAWLPGWHVHDNLCFDGSGHIVDIAEDGVCEAGFLVVTPPMIHVWRVDTPCGPFAGVDENGLVCDHEH